MRYRMQKFLRRTTSNATRVVAVLTLALVTACNRDDPLPTSPLRTLPTPLPAILGADITNLGFDGVAINQAGQVAGTLNGHAAVSTPGGGVLDLGTLGGPSSRGYAINGSGHVAGSSTTATGATHAFVWTPGEGMRDLGTLPGGTSSIARGMNDRGEVVGQSTRPRVNPDVPFVGPVTHAFRWTAALGMEDLGALAGLNASIAYDINNSGQVVGRAYSVDRVILPPTDPEDFSSAFLWTPGQGMRSLGGGIAQAINDAGTVVGRVATILPSHAWMWTPTDGFRSLGAFGSGNSSAAYGINEAGQIVGTSTIGLACCISGQHAFIWTASEGLESITPTTGISTAVAINDRLQVVGNGRVAIPHLAPGNVFPVAKTDGPYTGSEGSQVLFNMSGSDLDGGQLWGLVYYGDGMWDAFDTMLPHTSPSRTGTHVYADNGTYTLTLVASDGRGGRDTATTTVTVANVAPTILPGSLTGPATPLLLTGGSASAPIAFEFRDPAGISDVYAAEVACGNGVVLSATNVPVSNTISNGVYVGKGTYAGTCAYKSAGVYTVSVTVSDEDGGASAPAFFRYVVVFDPAGGSVTAGGFYGIPGQGNRKAHFTFSASFLAGHATTPNGSVKFWIPTRDLDFQGTAIEMLVVSANRAQFWGTGTLNGAPARFRITAEDGRKGAHNGSADAVRVELWDASGALVYDSQPGAAQDAPVTQRIEGGNIQIRSK